MHGMATLRKLVSSATCSLFLKNKIKIQDIDTMRDINLSWKVYFSMHPFKSRGSKPVVPQNLDVVNSCTSLLHVFLDYPLN